jgi:7,8-dihydropterin-6-yl-methyl-4-(beta-D-ribofuranosyl)aminobenzene 5'-phosphate synthase
MKCTVLVDNQANPAEASLRNEHGLSVLIQTKANTILFDTGASDLLAHNSTQLGIDLQAVDAVVLSHGHYDHAGGLAAFLKMNSEATAYCCPGALEPHVVKLFGFLSKDIGVSRKALNSFVQRFVEVGGITEIATGVYVVPHIPLSHATPKDMGMFFKKTGGRLQKDDFTHEILLVVKEQSGMTVLTGCAHKGVLNTMAAATGNFPGVPIEALIGGLHMTNPVTKRLSETEDDISLVGAQLQKNKTLKKLYAGHCTGPMAYSLLRQQMGGKIDTLMVGKQIVT